MMMVMTMMMVLKIVLAVILIHASVIETGTWWLTRHLRVKDRLIPGFSYLPIHLWKILQCTVMSGQNFLITCQE